MKQSCFILMLFISFLSIKKLEAKVKLPSVFSNNMVLQQQSKVPFWGDATPNKKVKITTSWNAKTIETMTDASGKWKTTVSTPVYGGPFTIEITDGTKLILENVLIGEVWLCSGQSNMEMPLAGWGKVLNYEQEISRANYPNIRLLHVTKALSTLPLNDVEVKMDGWVTCSPQTISEFSSVAYFYGRALSENLNVPIGLINASWGGTVAEAWTSGGTLKTMPDFTNKVTEMARLSAEASALQAKYNQDLAMWQKQVVDTDQGYKNGLPIWIDTSLDVTEWKTMKIPSLWENEGLHNFDGVVWLHKTITIPADWSNKPLTLNLDMIDDEDITYFNGLEVGRLNGYDKPRTYSIPAKLVKSGKAVITIRVMDMSGGGGIYGDSAQIKLSLENDKFISLAGVWHYKIGLNLADISSAPKNLNDPNSPTVLYNAMIHPLVPFTIKGVIWYQGESNENRAYQYRELFPLMIKDWRKQWGFNFPFYFVQLANYQNPAPPVWAELREAQLQALHLENTGMAVAVDIGEANDIHPKNKQEVARRLALIAMANLYDKKIACSGPIFEKYTIEGNTIRLKFNPVDGGLKTKNNEALKGFEIAGLDHQFHPADAQILGNDIVVSCNQVENPIAVRYAWADNPICNLYNGSDLPASPFRTDDWQGITFGNK